MALFDNSGFGNGSLAQFGQVFQAAEGVAFGGTPRAITDLVSAEVAQRGPIYHGPGASRPETDRFSVAKLSRSQKEAIQRAKKYAMEQGIKTVLLKQTIAHQHQQMLNVQQSIQRQQALALMCRVYVGTINFAIKEDTVKTAFAPFGPIKSISLPYDSVLKKHKGFAFIEYEIPEAASLALEQMNGVMICGFSIKVGRPSNMPQAQPIIERLMEEAKSYNRIFVASIHPDLSEPDVRSVFEAFGRIVSCKLATESTRPGKHKGYGYIEYETAEAAQDAITGMNLFDLGGQYLRVGRCVTPPNVCQVQVVPSSLPTASAIAAAAITAKLNALDAVNPQPLVPLTIARPSLVTTPGGVIGIQQLASSLLTTPMQFAGSGSYAGTGFSPLVQTAALTSMQLAGTLQGPVPVQTDLGSNTTAAEALDVQPSVQTQQFKPEVDPQQTLDQQQQSMIAQSTEEQNVVPTQTQLKKLSESRVMVLENMVGPEEVDEDLEDEVREECSRYGSVERVVIHMDDRKSTEPAVVKIFVDFIVQSETETAVAALNGRFFGGRSVVARLYDQGLYEANDLSG